MTNATLLAEQQKQFLSIKCHKKKDIHHSDNYSQKLNENSCSNLSYIKMKHKSIGNSPVTWSKQLSSYNFRRLTPYMSFGVLLEYMFLLVSSSKNSITAQNMKRLAKLYHHSSQLIMNPIPFHGWNGMFLQCQSFISQRCNRRTKNYIIKKSEKRKLGKTLNSKMTMKIHIYKFNITTLNKWPYLPYYINYAKAIVIHPSYRAIKA